MKQLKASMPDELAARLEAASAKSGRSLSAEICARVEASFARDVLDKPTRDFLDGVALMPAEIELETGAAWHKHLGAYEVFDQAIGSQLLRSKPKGSMAFGDRPHATVINDDPNQLGLLIEALLYKSPGYTGSLERKRLEEAHQKMLADLSKRGTKLAARVTPKDQLPTFEELTKGRKS